MNNDTLKLLERPLNDGQEVRIMNNSPCEGFYRVTICGDCCIDRECPVLADAVAQAAAAYVEWFNEIE
jgi:hypothetical protein